MQRKPSPVELLRTLKSWNRPTPHVLWQGEPVTKQQQRENMEWVHGTQISEVTNGHYTSVMDPFLCLLCEVLRMPVVNMYNGTKIVYSYRKCSDRLCCDPQDIAFGGKEMILANDRGHMWAARPTAIPITPAQQRQSQNNIRDVRNGRLELRFRRHCR